ncbi:MAG: TGS domain-containing protein, partial [Rhodospirillaceae bacterium]|nr:TGS domain-containing protein [Rhodospirillaceae bacterium]
MVAITLPDGSVRRFEGAITGEQLAVDIGPGLAKAALAVKIDGQVLDLVRPIEKDAAVAIITKKDP